MDAIAGIEAERRLAIMEMTGIGFSGLGKGSQRRKTEQYINALRASAYGRERRKKTNLDELERKRQEKLKQGLSIEEVEESLNPLFSFFATEFGMN